MAGTKALRVLVHPVPPVQDACRLVVRHLNATLQGRVAAAAAESGSVTWLDCEAAMLEPRAAALEVRVAGVKVSCSTFSLQAGALDDVFGGTKDPAKVLLGGAKFRQALSFDGVHMEPRLYTQEVLGVWCRKLES